MAMHFTKEQCRYLSEELPLPQDIAAVLNAAGPSGGQVALTGPQTVELREMVAARLQHVGFDAEYEPTAEGTMMESILDALSEDS